MFFTISQNRLVLLSSRGASTSSNKQNGAGFNRNNEKINANAVSAFSPPDNKCIELFFFPGGCAINNKPESRILLSQNSSWALPPVKIMRSKAVASRIHQAHPLMARTTVSLKSTTIF
jgi:hypothetical protein